jgi:hypothetical protein
MFESMFKYVHSPIPRLWGLFKKKIEAKIFSILGVDFFLKSSCQVRIS